MIDYPIIGMSPGNSYFKDGEIRYLLRSVIERYGHAATLVADVPAISTYIALGYPENRARRDKAIPKGNNLKNRIRKIAEELGLSSAVRVIEWEQEVEHNPEYLAAYEKIEHLYESNAEFRKSADSTTRLVLEQAEKRPADIEIATKIAIHYLLSEIAFLEFAPSFLEADKVTYVYHKNWPVYEDYLAGKFDGQPKTYLDFLLLENPYETYNPLWGLEGDDNDNDINESTYNRILRTKILRAGFANYWPALRYDPGTNTFSGIFYDVITEIAKKNSLEIRWTEEVGYGVIQDGLDTKRFDLFCSTVWPTPEREAEASFSIPLYSSRVYAWKKEGSANTPMSVAVKEGDISDSIATADFPSLRKVRVPQLATPAELLGFVAQRKADITFVEPYLAEQFNITSDTRVESLPGDPLRVYGNTFMFRKGEEDLKEFLDDQIQELLDSGFVAASIAKHTGSRSTFGIHLH